MKNTFELRVAANMVYSVMEKEMADHLSALWNGAADKIDELTPMLDIECAHYKYKLDRNGDLDICFCNHPENTDKHEGNCTKSLCPL